VGGEAVLETTHKITVGALLAVCWLLFWLRQEGIQLCFVIVPQEGGVL
jgi:hypothetical protein